MNRALTGLLVTVLLSCASQATQAQIKVVKKPALAVAPNQEVVYDA
jgi:hypothetical protein